jgi:hypothetical protein
MKLIAGVVATVVGLLALRHRRTAERRTDQAYHDRIYRPSASRITSSRQSKR